MSRPRTVPDEKIFQATRRLLSEGGDKATSFSAISQAAGLAASSLVQRYGSREGMVQAALLDGWQQLTLRTGEAEVEASLSAKGIPVLLKLIGRGHEAEIALLATQLRTRKLRDSAEDWRSRIEVALVLRLGGAGDKRRESAAMIFSAWLGRMVWAGPGGPGFRLKSIARKLG